MLCSGPSSLCLARVLLSWFSASLRALPHWSRFTYPLTRRNSSYPPFFLSSPNHLSVFFWSENIVRSHFLVFVYRIIGSNPLPMALLLRNSHASQCLSPSVVLTWEQLSLTRYLFGYIDARAQSSDSHLSGKLHQLSLYWL